MLEIKINGFYYFKYSKRQLLSRPTRSVILGQEKVRFFFEK